MVMLTWKSKDCSTWLYAYVSQTCKSKLKLLVRFQIFRFQMECSACTLFERNLLLGATLRTPLEKGLYKTPHVTGWRTGTENQRKTEARWTWGEITTTGWVGNSRSRIITMGIQVRRTSVVRANKTLSDRSSSAAILTSATVTLLLARDVAAFLLIAQNAMIEVINSVM